LTVTREHPSYVAQQRAWKMFEDAAAGELQIKAARETYLPRPNPSDTSQENKERFEAYLRRAVYYGVTGRTLKSFVGMAYMTDPTVDLPPAISGLADDISGSGLTLLQQSQSALSEVLKAGRAGLLADYPKTSGEISKAQLLTQQIQPTLTLYRAMDIRNWRVSKVGGKYMLVLVVLAESKEEAEEDGFGVKETGCYRVLKLAPIVPGSTTLVYTVEVWEQQAGADLNTRTWSVADTFQPKRGDGTNWSEIPFTFSGSENNDWTVDDAPLGDLAFLNIAHYRNSADYEDSVYTVGQPQLWVAGLDERWRDWLQIKGIYLGSRAPLLLPKEGSAGLLQASPNTLAKEAMDAKEKQMAALGARLIQAINTVKTATQQESEDGVAHSVLSLCCENVSSAYRKALGWCAIFASADDSEVDFSISGEFTRSALDGPTLTVLMQMVQAGIMPMSDFWDRMRDAGYISSDKDDDDLREELEQDAANAMPDLGAAPAPTEPITTSVVPPVKPGAVDAAGNPIPASPAKGAAA
jgi:Domain of unknown function (DUF4055)